MGIKQHCPRCDRDLTVEAYYERDRGKRGKYCADCMRAYLREWKRAHYLPKTTPCAADGCRTPTSNLYCAVHSRPVKPRRLPGTYAGVHQRVARLRGPAATHKCRFCGGRAQDWAYDHRDPYELVQVRNGVKVYRFSVDPARYVPACRSCHTLVDRR